MPGSWGLVGDAYLEAEAHYNLDGYDLERRLLDIRLRDDQARWELELLDLDLRHNRITEHAAAIRRVVLTHPPGVERDLALLAVNHEHGEVDDIAFQKQRAGLKNEPWIGIVTSGFDPEQGVDGVYLEFDWNQQWIEFLRTNGYSGRSDEQVIDEWFSDVCRSHQMNDTLMPFSIARTE